MKTQKQIASSEGSNFDITLCGCAKGLQKLFYSQSKPWHFNKDNFTRLLGYNPNKTNLSASSKTRYSTLDRRRFISTSTCINRPGVATIISGLPWRASNWSSILSPPRTHADFRLEKRPNYKIVQHVQRQQIPDTSAVFQRCTEREN